MNSCIELTHEVLLKDDDVSLIGSFAMNHSLAMVHSKVAVVRQIIFLTSLRQFFQI